MSVRLIICKKVLPFSLALTLASSAVIAHAADLYGGDVNGNGRVNVTDLSKLAAYVKGVKPLDNSELAQADVNADRMVNVTDISLLADHIKSGGDESSKPQEKSDDAQRKELARLTNAERSRLSLSELTYSDELAELAQIRAQELLEYFPTDAYHTRPDGRSALTILDDYGYYWTACAENICYGAVGAQSAFETFKGSEGHYQNMIRSDYNRIGIGLTHSDDGTWYWVMLFAKQ